MPFDEGQQVRVKASAAVPEYVRGTMVHVMDKFQRGGATKYVVVSVLGLVIVDETDLSPGPGETVH